MCVGEEGRTYCWVRLGGLSCNRWVWLSVVELWMEGCWKELEEGRSLR